jgi:hypothetical protein
LITKDWEDFNKNITLGKEISIYEDEEGNYAEIDTRLLRCGVQYNELTEEQLNVAKFENKIPKDMKLKTKERPKYTSKDKLTGKDSDKFTIIENGKEQVYIVWFIIDGLKNMKAYAKREEALEKAKARNKEINAINKENGHIPKKEQKH